MTINETLGHLAVILARWDDSECISCGEDLYENTCRNCEEDNSDAAVLEKVVWEATHA